MIDVEESTEPEYYPPDGDLPSLELALEHARNQYCDCFNVKNAIITKATITLSFSMAMIALIGSVQFELLSIAIFIISIIISIDMIFPKSHKHPNPKPEDYFSFAKHEKTKAMDLLLISYMKINEELMEQNRKMGNYLIVNFIIIAIGLTMFLLQLNGFEITLIGVPV